MKKRSFSQRLALLNHGRTALLNFLRNLPVLAVLIGMTLLAAQRVNFHDLGHTVNVLAVSLALAIGAALAFYANVSIFINDCHGDTQAWITRIEQLSRARDASHLGALACILRAVARWKWLELLEVCFIIFFVQACFLITFVQAGLLFINAQKLLDQHAQPLAKAVVVPSAGSKAPPAKP